MYRFEQILEATPNKTAVVQPRTSHFTNKKCKALLEKQGQTHKWCPLIDTYAWMYQWCPTSKDLHSSVLCGCRMQLRRPTKSCGWWRCMLRERERESQKIPCCQHNFMMMQVFPKSDIAFNLLPGNFWKDTVVKLYRLLSIYLDNIIAAERHGASATASLPYSLTKSVCWSMIFGDQHLFLISLHSHLLGIYQFLCLDWQKSNWWPESTTWWP